MKAPTLEEFENEPYIMALFRKQEDGNIRATQIRFSADGWQVVRAGLNRLIGKALDDFERDGDEEKRGR